jgi:hypothetical protein
MLSLNERAQRAYEKENEYEDFDFIDNHLDLRRQNSRLEEDLSSARYQLRQRVEKVSVEFINKASVCEKGGAD